MMAENGLRIGSYLLAIALFGALTMQAGFAEEPGSGARDDSKASHLSAEPSGSQAPAGEDAAGRGRKLDDQLSPQAQGDESKSGEGARTATHTVATDPYASAAGDKSFDDIDTQNSVQPRRLSGRRDKVGEGKTKPRSLARSALYSRKPSAPEASDRLVRNAIGVPVARHEGSEQRNGAHRDFSTVVHSPAAGAVGFVTSATGRLAKAEGHFDRPAANANPIVRPAAANRGAINGTGLIRSGFALSGVGGPAAPLAGINGTTIRSKHR